MEDGKANKADDAIAVEEIICSLLPDIQDRFLVLEQLLESIGVADSIAPNAWGVTLFEDGFRLNVGQAEVLVLATDQIRVNLCGPKTGNGACSANVKPSRYKSIPQPQFAFVGTISAFRMCRQHLLSQHKEFLRLAALSPKGMPRKGSPHTRSHCEYLVNYARFVTGS